MTLGDIISRLGTHLTAFSSIVNPMSGRIKDHSVRLSDHGFSPHIIRIFDLTMEIMAENFQKC